MMLNPASIPCAARTVAGSGAALRRGLARTTDAAGANSASARAMRRLKCTNASGFQMMEVADENQRRDIAVVLVSPQIPGNTGTIARTCAATRVPLHLVGPLGFELTDSQLKRAGLDYWQGGDNREREDEKILQVPQMMRKTSAKGGRGRRGAFFFFF